MVKLLRRSAKDLHKSLSKVKTVEGLERVLLNRSKPLEGLRNAIISFERQESINFWEILFPAIVSFLDERSGPKNIDLLYCKTNSSIRLTHVQMRFVLANAFFLNIKNNPTDGFGFFDFGLLMLRADPLSEQRLQCMLGYFAREMNSDSEDIHQDIIIERHYEGESSFPDWVNSSCMIDIDTISVHTGRIEDVVGKWDVQSHSSGTAEITIVDFANKQIHIGIISPSMTQEEVVFSCAPECFLCLLVCEQLLPQEVVIVKNVRRSVEYTGFLYSFKQQSILHDAAPMNVLALDASPQNSFGSETVIRDLNKAWIGFKYSTEVISTGHWGCGAFGGDETFKFLQQVCVAAVLEKKLHYSTFKNEEFKNEFNFLLKEIKTKSKSVGEITKALLEYYPSIKSHSFKDYTNEWINK